MITPVEVTKLSVNLKAAGITPRPKSFFPLPRVKLLFAGAIRRTTMNKNSRACRSTNSCVASYYTSFPKASCAFDISAFWPTAGAPSFYRFAFSCWVQLQKRSPKHTLPPPMTLLISIPVPSVQHQ